MNVFKLSLFSLIRKPVKSILLAIILYFIALFLLMAVGIGQQQQEVQKEILNQLDASFRIETTEAAWERMEPHIKLLEIFEGGITDFTDWNAINEHQGSLNAKDMKKIGDINGISGFNILAGSERVIPLDFENDQSQTGLRRPNPYDVMVTIQPTWNLAYLDETKHQFISLTSGRFIDETDRWVDGAPLVISQNMATKNNLIVGDKISFEWMDEEFEVALDYFNEERIENIQATGTIVGIFNVDRPLIALGNSATLENTIYTAFDFPENFFMGTRYEKRLFNSQAVFHVENPAEYEQIREQIKTLDLDWERYKLVDANDMMLRMSSSFDGLQLISDLIFWVVFLAGFGMLWLTFIFLVRNRENEIAILLSIGFLKVKILMQFLIEALFIATIAFSLAVITLPIGQFFIDVGALNHQITESNFLNEALTDEEMQQIFVTEGETTNTIMSNDFYEMATNSISITFESILFVILSLTGIIIFSIVLSLIPIMRLKPREIFSKVS